MLTTGHNSYLGCRFCNLRGTLNKENNRVYFPLQNVDPKHLPIRTNEDYLNKINQLSYLKERQKENFIRDCG